MKTTIKTFVKKISVTLLVVAAFVLPSCKIGLGEALDLKGPSVEITSPESRENVKDKFTISGIVTDDFEIGTVTVKITYDKEFKGEWKNENASWKHRATANGDYSSYGNATWEVSADRKSVKWTINDVNPTGAGVFKITVSAVDATGNTSEESTKSRDVIIDGTPPLIEIAKPKLSSDKSTFDVPDYKDITKINMFMTGDFTITGYAKDDNTIKFVDLRLIGADDGKEYFAKRLDIDADPNIDSLRAWDIGVVLNECDLGLLDSTRHVLSVYTNTADAAGNTNNDLVFQGYTCLWRDADIPWIAMPEFKGTTAAAPKQVYSGSPLQGTAYDDTAVSKVTVTMKSVDTAGVVGNVVAGFSDKILYEVKEGAEDDNNIPFDLVTPEDCEKFYVELRAFDNKGNVSETTAGYIKVEDKTYPAIDIAYSDGHNENIKADGDGKDENNTEVSPKQKSSGDTLFGDPAGNFTFNIRAFDDTQVTSIKMVYIDKVRAADVVKYADSTYTGWTTATIISFTDTGKIDNSIGINRKIYKAYRKMNLFGNGTENTLGIDGDTKKLENQTFVFRIEDNNGNAMTKTYTIQGDVEAPEIEFTKIRYYNGDDESTFVKEYGDPKEDNNEQLQPFSVSTKVVIYGKIKDNSAKVWGNTKAFNFNQAQKKFKLVANDVDITPTSIGADGSFTATARNLKGASLLFDGTLTDYAGNSVSAKYSRLVNTQKPNVEYISSYTENGYYGANKNIDIYIRFNMLMKYATGTTPTLTLNNGGTANIYKNYGSSDTGMASEYATPENTSKNEFHFIYTTTSSSKEIADLNVTAVNGLTIYKSDGSDISTDINGQLAVLTKRANLSDMKDITILINAPQLESGYPKWNESAGTLTLKYNKPVARGSGEVKITQQKSGGGDGIDRVPAAMLKSKYDKVVAQSPDIAKYYEAGINGTDPSWTPIYDAKYILKYDYNSDGTGSSGANPTPGNLISLYEKAGIHILTYNVKSPNVKISEDKKTVTVNFGKYPLPCKGVKYKLEIPAGFMQDEKGGSTYGTAAITNNTTTVTSAGCETPVIRVNLKKPTISGSTATQPFMSNFKVDCESDYDANSLKYSWVMTKTQNSEVWPGHNDDAAQTQTSINYNNNQGGYPQTQAETSYTVSETGESIGIDNDYSGLIYKITATVKKGGTTYSGYNKVCRSGIEVRDLNVMSNGKMKADYNYTSESEWKGKDKSIGLFIKGGDNESGGNNVKGLPISWDPRDYKNYLMFTNTENNNYKLLSWSITSEKLYFWYFAGIIDDETENGNGPTHAIAAQNNYTNHFKDYPLHQGEYIVIYNKVNKNGGDSNVNFRVEDFGKPLKVR